MKYLDNFRIFESNWWMEKLNEFDLDEDEVKDYLSYITDEFENIQLEIEKGFWNDDLKPLDKKNDLIKDKYYPGYKIRIKNDYLLNLNTNKILIYTKLLQNALDSLNNNYYCWIYKADISDFGLVCLDKTQTIENESLENRNISEIIMNKLSKISNICSIVDTEQLGGEGIYVKEKQGTTPDELKEALNKLFKQEIYDNEIKISETSLIIKKDSKGNYYSPSRLERGFQRVQYKKVFLIVV